MMMNSLSRRDVLRLAGGLVTAAAAMPLTNLMPALGQANAALGQATASGLALAPDTPDAPPTPLGRVAEISAVIRADAVSTSKLVRTVKRDDVLTLTGQVKGQAVMPYNDIWFKTDDGYIYSSGVQPVQNIKNDPLPDKAAEHFWGEITVPFTDSRATPDASGRKGMRLEYSTVYRVIAAVQDKSKNWWYRLQDGVSYSPGPYILASDIRRIDPSDVTPLSPDVVNKRIEVNLKAQTITAFEDDKPVLTHLICSGAGGFGTPRGTHKVLFKTVTSRMIGGSGNSYYDLPGVPFCTFFTWSGVAIHGTYWHNDYGRPRSHGCVNVPSDVSRWFWRWTLPTAPYDNKVFYSPRAAPATKIVVL